MKRPTLIIMLLLLALSTTPIAYANVHEYDVVVVGGGAAGLVAATVAAEAGASVVLLEKMSFLGGASITAGGMTSVVLPEVQSPHGIEDSIDAHFEETWSAGDYLGHPHLVRTMVERAPEGVRHAMERGLEWDGTVQLGSGQKTPRWLRPVGSGVAWIQVYTEALAQAGGEVLLNTEVVEILREEQLSGRVYGVKALSDGETLEFRARNAVILASGGFTANVEMRMRHDHRLGPQIPSAYPPSSSGEVIVQAQNIGAATTHMDYIQLLDIGSPIRGDITGRAGGSSGGTINVNKEGKRYVNETDRRDVLVDSLFQQTDDYMFIISDSRGVVGEAQMERLIEEGSVYKADTIAELAELIGVPSDALEETVARWNEIVHMGQDPDFGRLDARVTIEEAPFYATPRVPIVHTTLGGVFINEETQVIDRYGEIIPGLFAAGTVTGGIHGTNRVSGTAFTEIAAFAPLAGKNAAEGK